MKSALVYLLLTRLKAQFKEMVRKPARLIYLVLVIALFAITLLGGGSQLFALDRALSRQLKLTCRVAEEPQACVCMGVGRAMEEGGGYERAMFDLRTGTGRKRK